MKYIKEFENKNTLKKVEYQHNGKKYYEYYFMNDEYHREDGPAYQVWYKNGQKKNLNHII